MLPQSQEPILWCTYYLNWYKSMLEQFFASHWPCPFQNTQFYDSVYKDHKRAGGYCHQDLAKPVWRPRSKKNVQNLGVFISTQLCCGLLHQISTHLLLCCDNVVILSFSWFCGFWPFFFFVLWVSCESQRDWAALVRKHCSSWSQQRSTPIPVTNRCSQRLIYSICWRNQCHFPP